MSEANDSEIHCTTVRVSDSGLKVRSYDSDGGCIAESVVPASDVVDIIESHDEHDEKQLQHGPKPRAAQ